MEEYVHGYQPPCLDVLKLAQEYSLTMNYVVPQSIICSILVTACSINDAVGKANNIHNKQLIYEKQLQGSFHFKVAEKIYARVQLIKLNTEAMSLHIGKNPSHKELIILT